MVTAILLNLVQFMLSKVSTDTISITKNVTTTLIASTTVTPTATPGQRPDNYIKLGVTDIPEPGQYKLQVKVSGAANYTYLYMVSNDGNKTKLAFDAQYGATTITTPAVNLLDYDSIQYGIGANGDTSTRTLTDFVLIQTYKYLVKNKKPKLYPVTVNSIGEKNNPISFGRLPNGNWRDGN